MTSIVRSVLGAAFVLAGASAAMAATDNPPVANQPAQTDPATVTVASNDALLAGQPPKTFKSDVPDNADTYGGHDPKSTAGARAFWESQNPY